MATPDHPPVVPDSLRHLRFVCPACRGDLAVDRTSYSCAACARSYPVHDGIPDFRLYPDPYLSIDEDRARAEFVIGELDRHDLESLLTRYWSVSDVTPEVLRGRFVRSALIAEAKAESAVDLAFDAASREGRSIRAVLEVGSGTGGFLAVAARRCDLVVGIDIAMRWLHVSRRRFLDRGLPVPPLVCCCAEHLPFPDGAFDLVAMSATLEFAQDADGALAESARVLSGQGALYVNTANRYSVARDPYVYLWGLGFLPRALQAKYARWRRNASYENIRLLSLRELDRAAARSFADRAYRLQDPPDSALDRFPLSTRLQVRAYRLVKNLPLVRRLLLVAGPGWDAVFLKGDRRDPRPDPIDSAAVEGAAAVTVVVPMYNAAAHAERFLTALRTSTRAPDEIIVVDDCSTDGGGEICANGGAVVLRMPRQSGPGAARNHGVARARGQIVMFVDSDVVVAPDAIARAEAALIADPSLAAVFGSYDENPPERNFFSQFKNLAHRFVHQAASRDAETFWAGCGAVRKNAFLAVGGFDADRYPRPSIEDIELGYRLRRAGHRILLDKGMQATHLKRWTFASWLRTDIFCRAVPWSFLILRSRRLVDDLNVSPAERLRAVVAWALALAYALGTVSVAALAVAAVLTVVTCVMNHRFISFFLKRRGIGFTALALLVQHVYYLYSSATFAICWFLWVVGGRRETDDGPCPLPDEEA